MKRYLTGYSKNTLTIRDRQTGQEKRVTNCDKETADLIQDAIKSTNYTLNKTKSKVRTLSMEDEQEWLRSVNKEFITEFGWIKPEKINWSKDEVKELAQETVDGLKELTNKLDELLKEI